MNEQSILEAHARFRTAVCSFSTDPTAQTPDLADIEADDGAERTNPDAA